MQFAGDLQNLDLAELDFLLFELEKSHFKFPPSSMKDFLHDPYYLKPILQGSLYPYWEDMLKDVQPIRMHSPYTEIILRLPLGVGKSVISAVLMAKQLEKILALKNPTAYHGLMSSTKIVFSMFSRTKVLAQDVNWDVLQTILNDAPFFKEHLYKLPKRSSMFDLGIEVAPNIAIDLGSRSTHAIGKAVICALLDEGNFFNEKSRQAYEAYTELHYRIESRFLLNTGRNPGLLILASSPLVETDFVSERIELSKDLKTTKIINEVPKWVIEGHKQVFKDMPKFPVYCGDGEIDPFIMQPDQEYPNIDYSKVLGVPVIYKDSFNKDLLASLKNIAGLGTRSGLNLFKSVEGLRKLMTAPNYFTKEIVNLDFYMKEDVLQNYVVQSYFANPMYPECPRFIHADVAYSKDLLGLSSVYLKPSEHHSGIGTDYMFYVDWCVGVKAKDKQEIPLYKILAFIQWLVELGYPIQEFSYDKFQSTYLKQLVELTGVKTRYISVDTTRDPYLALRNITSEGKILFPKHKHLGNELINLRDNGTKIDHPSNIGKDISDSVCGSFFNCFNHSNTGYLLLPTHKTQEMQDMDTYLNLLSRGAYKQNKYF